MVTETGSCPLSRYLCAKEGRRITLDLPVLLLVLCGLWKTRKQRKREGGRFGITYPSMTAKQPRCLTRDGPRFRNGQAWIWASVVSAIEYFWAEVRKQVFFAKTRIYLTLKVSLTNPLNFPMRQLTKHIVH